jgi:hypothetical protein
LSIYKNINKLYKTKNKGENVMNKEYREKLIKEIARKVDVDMCLDYLIGRYNEEFEDLNITKDEFGIRLARTPEEACYISAIITIPKSEMDICESDVREKAKYYDSLIEKAFKEKYDFMKPKNLENIKSWDELEVMSKLYEIKVFKMNEYEWYATKWSSEKTNDWYNKNIEDNDIEDVELSDLDSEGMWYETNDKEDIAKLGDSDELISYEVINDKKVPKAQFGDLKRYSGDVYKYISFRDAVAFDIYFKEPYCIACTDW